MPSFDANIRISSNDIEKAATFPIDTRREHGTVAFIFFFGIRTQGLVCSGETKMSLHVQSLIALKGVASAVLS